MRRGWSRCRRTTRAAGAAKSAARRPSCGRSRAAQRQSATSTASPVTGSQSVLPLSRSALRNTRRPPSVSRTGTTLSGAWLSRGSSRRVAAYTPPAVSTSDENVTGYHSAPGRTRPCFSSSSPYTAPHSASVTPPNTAAIRSVSRRRPKATASSAAVMASLPAQPARTPHPGRYTATA